MKKLTIKASTKYKINDPDEMALYMHMKRKGASVKPSKKAYKRKEKHKKMQW